MLTRVLSSRACVAKKWPKSFLFSWTANPPVTWLTLNYQNFDGRSSATRKRPGGRNRIRAVFTAKSRGEVVAIKKLFRQNAYEKRLLLKEAKILKDQSHDHIVWITGFCTNPLAIISLSRSWTFWCEFLHQTSPVQMEFLAFEWIRISRKWNISAALKQWRLELVQSKCIMGC